jgi:hypothetical protein
VQRGALIGAMIAGVAGLAWSLWAAGGASGAAAVAIRVVGIALGLALVVAAGLRMRGAAPDGGGSLFRGGALLNLTGNGQYVIAWYAFVVGVHFLVFGRLFHARFHGLGIAMVVAAAAGAVAGLAGGGPAPILLISGMLSAAALFVVGALAVRSPAGRDRRDVGGTAGGGSAA